MQITAIRAIWRRLAEVRNKIFDYASDDKKIEFDSSICDEVWADMEANWDYWRER